MVAFSHVDSGKVTHSCSKGVFVESSVVSMPLHSLSLWFLYLNMLVFADANMKTVASKSEYTKLCLD